MNKSKNLLKIISENYKLSFVELNYFANNNLSVFNINSDLELNDFKLLRSVFYAMFDSIGIYSTVIPHNVIQEDNKFECKWKYIICVDGTEVTESNYNSREDAEFIAFKKCFSYYETKLFIEFTKHRYWDETADSSCLNVNWEHLKRVLNYKRKHLIS